jgi:hypothetical protein
MERAFGRFVFIGIPEFNSEMVGVYSHQACAGTFYLNVSSWYISSEYGV